MACLKNIFTSDFWGIIVDPILKTRHNYDKKFNYGGGKIECNEKRNHGEYFQMLIRENVEMALKENEVF